MKPTVYPRAKALYARDKRACASIRGDISYPADITVSSAHAFSDSLSPEGKSFYALRETNLSGLRKQDLLSTGVSARRMAVECYAFG